jgi:hypothetical protein
MPKLKKNNLIYIKNNMQVKHKNIELNLAQCKRVADIAVIMGFHFKVDKQCLNMLKCNHPSDTNYNGMESASLGYALYELVKEKLAGSPLEIAKSKVSRISCNGLNGKFLLSWNTSGFSGLRKTLAVALGCLSAPKLYSKYAENMKLLGGKSDREVFNTVANQMTDAIKKSIKFGVIGKIKVDEPKIKDLLSKVEPKIPNQEILKGTKPIPKYTDHIHSFPKVKASGIEAIAVADYISAKSGGMSVDVFDGYVVVYNKNADTKIKQLKNKGRISDYVKKYEKLKDDFYGVFGYMAIIQNLAECCTISTIIKSKPKASEMVDLIFKNI